MCPTLLSLWKPFWRALTRQYDWRLATGKKGVALKCVSLNPLCLDFIREQNPSTFCQHFGTQSVPKLVLHILLSPQLPAHPQPGTFQPRAQLSVTNLFSGSPCLQIFHTLMHPSTHPRFNLSQTFLACYSPAQKNFMCICSIFTVSDGFFFSGSYLHYFLCIFKFYAFYAFLCISAAAHNIFKMSWGIYTGTRTCIVCNKIPVRLFLPSNTSVKAPS